MVKGDNRPVKIREQQLHWLWEPFGRQLVLFIAVVVLHPTCFKLTADCFLYENYCNVMIRVKVRPAVTFARSQFHIICRKLYHKPWIYNLRNVYKLRAEDSVRTGVGLCLFSSVWRSFPLRPQHLNTLSRSFMAINRFDLLAWGYMFLSFYISEVLEVDIKNLDWVNVSERYQLWNEEVKLQLIDIRHFHSY